MKDAAVTAADAARRHVEDATLNANEGANWVSAHGCVSAREYVCVFVCARECKSECEGTRTQPRKGKERKGRRLH